jgi:hypothetical protein
MTTLDAEKSKASRWESMTRLIDMDTRDSEEAISIGCVMLFLLGDRRSSAWRYVMVCRDLCCAPSHFVTSGSSFGFLQQFCNNLRRAKIKKGFLSLNGFVTQMSSLGHNDYRICGMVFRLVCIRNHTAPGQSLFLYGSLVETYVKSGIRHFRSCRSTASPGMKWHSCSGFSLVIIEKLWILASPWLR